MDRQAQIALLKRLLQHVESKTTALADMPWQNDTSVYFDPEHFHDRSLIPETMNWKSWLILSTRVITSGFCIGNL